jgi:hypothetical protein
MDKALRKRVFHETEVAGITFRATLREGRVLLHVEDARGRESEVQRKNPKLPSLRGRKSGEIGAFSSKFA